jgi:hypothetical protein
MTTSTHFTRMLTKPETQDILKALRKRDDMEVSKVTGGYSVLDNEGQLVLRAMIGTRGYLVRFNKGWFNAN